jgi:hypothetical protein
MPSVLRFPSTAPDPTDLPDSPSGLFEASPKVALRSTNETIIPPGEFEEGPVRPAQHPSAAQDEDWWGESDEDEAAETDEDAAAELTFDPDVAEADAEPEASTDGGARLPVLAVIAACVVLLLVGTGCMLVIAMLDTRAAATPTTAPARTMIVAPAALPAPTMAAPEDTDVQPAAVTKHAKSTRAEPLVADAPVDVADAAPAVAPPEDVAAPASSDEGDEKKGDTTKKKGLFKKRK